jgi:hypothetical protein
LRREVESAASGLRNEGQTVDKGLPSHGYSEITRESWLQHKSLRREAKTRNLSGKDEEQTGLHPCTRTERSLSPRPHHVECAMGASPEGAGGRTCGAPWVVGRSEL